MLQSNRFLFKLCWRTILDTLFRQLLVMLYYNNSTKLSV
ncbi:hypothetical protein A1OE_436 [Candidatus Endolissoclinum faulkneri L2]|uniref:Uncharacterized protein n=1 Tax=Candidatus Endolissoclinum faulkneri L2 TaxID=1193729 RepID=K7YPX7_9PROT|nr:hypothetical protein A1OE_436 [Candidatus Endolissoclinum faulkneri L2]